jgi:hypothetical protein
MKYSELIQTYFERSNALQWYWTLYVLVIGGVLAFSSFRQRPDLITTALVTILYACFAYKNLGAIEATTEELLAVLSAIEQFPAAGPEAEAINRARSTVQPTLQPTPIGGLTGVRAFHIMCDLLTVAVVWVKEWRRRRPVPLPTTATT